MKDKTDGTCSTLGNTTLVEKNSSKENNC